TPDVELRFASASEMHRAWIAGFEAPAATALAPAVASPGVDAGAAPIRPHEYATAAWDPADLTEEQLAAIRPETPTEALPLSPPARHPRPPAGPPGGPAFLPAPR